MIICHLNFKRTENHKITTTNTSQHVEFFHSLIFLLVVSLSNFKEIAVYQTAIVQLHIRFKICIIVWIRTETDCATDHENVSFSRT